MIQAFEGDSDDGSPYAGLKHDKVPFYWTQLE